MSHHDPPPSDPRVADLHDEPRPAAAACEPHEVAVSALLDGELPPSETLALLDHLTACDSCARFYRECRAVDGAVLAADTGDLAVTPAPEVWERIAAASAPPAATASATASPGASLGAGPFAGRHGWALRAAAVLAAAAIAFFALRGSEPEGAAVAGSRAPLEIELASDAGAMSDARFVALAAEVLRSDPRYHRKMLEILQLVASPGGDEGSVDDRVVRGVLAGDRARGDGDGDESSLEPGDWRV